MTVYKRKHLYCTSDTDTAHDQHSERGASLLEVLLTMAIMALIAPMVYNQISDTSHELQDISTAKDIIKIREPALNFVRLNQGEWPDVAQIKLDNDELAQISDIAHAGFIDKYSIKGSSVTDVYLAFDTSYTTTRSARIASHIGQDGAIVGPDGIAYGEYWAVAAPDFNPGNLIYRISRNFSGDDNSKYLHRGSAGEDELNVMMRPLNMGQFDLYNVGTISSETAKLTDTTAAFTDTKQAGANAAYFTRGANLDGGGVNIKSIRVNGDITGFRSITTKILNKEGFVTNGRVIADRATVNNSVTVGRNMTLKSDSIRTISGFSGITAHSLAVPYLSATDLLFHNNFGLTISGELLMSTTAPLRIGSWIFPSITPPAFSKFELTRAKIPTAPNASEFDKIINSGWRDITPITP